MKTQTALIDALRAAFPNDSDAAIARRAKLSQQRFSNYAQAIRTMDDDAIIGCAGLVGWDAKKTLATHHAETAKTDRERSFWRQFGAAAALAVALFPLGNARAEAMQVIDSSSSLPSNAYYVNSP